MMLLIVKDEILEVSDAKTCLSKKGEQYSMCLRSLMSLRSLTKTLYQALCFIFLAIYRRITETVCKGSLVLNFEFTVQISGLPLWYGSRAVCAMNSIGLCVGSGLGPHPWQPFKHLSILH